MPPKMLTPKHTNKSTEQRQQASKGVSLAVYYLVHILHHAQCLLLNLPICLYALFRLQHLLRSEESLSLIHSTVDAFSFRFSGNLEVFNALYFKKIESKSRYRALRSVEPFLGDMLGTGSRGRLQYSFTYSVILIYDVSMLSI